jgi:large subunit ribosomal protein L13
LATRLSCILRGKHKPVYTPFLDTGDFVVVINAEKLAVTGRKREQKAYMRYSGYPSGHKTQTMDALLRRHPDRVLRLAVKRMLPQGPMGRHMLGKLKIYAGTAHPHAAQQPQPMPPQLLGAKAAHG